MKQYPEISRVIQYNRKVYVFDKLDGSNIRAEWKRKNGFYKFGSRNCLIDPSHPHLGESIELIKQREDSLSSVFSEQRWDSVICFFEFYGEHSFAGLHEKEPHCVSLLDVNVHKKGILRPNEFIHLFSNFEIPTLLYHGNMTVPIVQTIERGNFEGMTFEGVVCKGIPDKKSQPPIMFKIKNQAWIERLRAHCKGDEKRFQELL